MDVTEFFADFWIPNVHVRVETARIGIKCDIIQIFIDQINPINCILKEIYVHKHD